MRLVRGRQGGETPGNHAMNHKVQNHSCLDPNHCSNLGMVMDQDAQFQLETNTSGYATGAILSQLCNDSKWHPVGFTSKSLTIAKRNYFIHDKEVLSVI